MNRIDETMNPTEPESRLDRLVDGELNETARRELLLQFEREPEGWRRCALAFLEAQCWKQELGVMSRLPEVVSAQSAPQPTPASLPAATVRTAVSRWRQNLATALTMGACFLIALAIGVSIRGKGPHGADANLSTVTAPLSPNDSQATPISQPADELITVDGADGATESLRVPRAHRDAIDQNVAEQGPDAIPPAVQQAFQRAGHEVVQQREIVPGQMYNGRQLMVPVDHVEIHYVGNGGRGSF